MQIQTSRPEIPFRSISGWPMLPLILAMLVLPGILVGARILPPEPFSVATAVLTGAVGLVMAFGFFIVNPNTARVLVLFGRYRGTERRDGLHWTNPFTLR